MIARLTPTGRATIPIAVALLLAACTSSTGGVSTPHAFGESLPATPSALPSVTPTSAATETAVPSAQPPSPSPSAAPLQLTSGAFAANGPIPREYTCRGTDRSPDLAWTGVPADARALVLFVDDPDGGDWVHWSVLDIDPATSGLPAGVKPAADPPQQGTNDFGKVGYGGPCPPSGTHHYQFTLYALAAPLGLDGHPKGSAVRAALAKAHPIAKVTLVGTFAH
jgi:Raf kinase inhibitor-like YbhB/YbcL family protein